MGGHHGGSGGTTYKGYTLYPPKRWHVVTGKGLCAIMCGSGRFRFGLGVSIEGKNKSGFWVFYRAKQDGPVLLGWRHPWEGHDDHSHGHGDGHESSH